NITEDIMKKVTKNITADIIENIMENIILEEIPLAVTITTQDYYNQAAFEFYEMQPGDKVASDFDNNQKMQNESWTRSVASLKRLL
ncbi:19286_t:CDS:2, partial [Gigaspora margarita]